MTAALALSDLLRDKQDWTVDDLASLPDDLRYELIDGRLILPSPTFMHQEICIELATMLRPNCPPGYAIVIDVSLEVDRRNEPRPDVVVARRDAGSRSPAPIQSALLIAEVISPTSEYRDMNAKREIFAAAGVGSYWVIDPRKKNGVVLTEFRLGGDGRYETVTNTDKVFTPDVPYPVRVDLPVLTAIRNLYR